MMPHKMDIQTAIKTHGAKAVYAAGCQALEGDYSALQQMGLPAASLADAWAALGAHENMTMADRVADQVEVMATLSNRGS